MDHFDISLNSSQVSYFDVKEYTWMDDITKFDLFNIIDNLDKPIVIRNLFKKSEAYKKWNIENITDMIDNKVKLNTIIIDKDINSLCNWCNSYKKRSINELLEYYDLLDSNNIAINDILNYNLENHIQIHRNLHNESKKQLIKDINIDGVDSVIFNNNPIILSINNNNSEEMKHSFNEDIFISQLTGETDYYICELNKNNDIIKHKNIIDILDYNNDNFRYPSHYIQNNEKKYNFLELDHSLLKDLHKVKLKPGDSLLIPPNWWYANKNNGITTHFIKYNKRSNYNYFLDYPDSILKYYFSGLLTNHLFYNDIFKNLSILMLIGFIICIHIIATKMEYKFISIIYVYSFMFLFILLFTPSIIKYVYNS